MQTRQTIAAAILAFATITNCQMTPLDDECDPVPSATVTIGPSSSAPVFTPISQLSSAAAGGDAGATFSLSSAPAASSSPAQVTTSVAQAASSSAVVVPSSHAIVPSSSSSALPAQTSAAGSSTPSSGSSGQGLSGACAPNGMFNCVGGTQFQQCANGQWAALIPLAGTKCSEGQSMTLWRREEDSDKGTFHGRRRAN